MAQVTPVTQLFFRKDKPNMEYSASQAIALLILCSQQAPIIIDMPTRYEGLKAIIGGSIVEMPLDDDVIALCPANFTESANRVFGDKAICGSKFLVVAKSAFGYEGLNAHQLNHYMELFEREESL